MDKQQGNVGRRGKMGKKEKICTFNRVMSLKDAENEKGKSTSLGRSLREADELDRKRKR